MSDKPVADCRLCGHSEEHHPDNGPCDVVMESIVEFPDKRTTKPCRCTGYDPLGPQEPVKR